MYNIQYYKEIKKFISMKNELIIENDMITNLNN